MGDENKPIESKKRSSDSPKVKKSTKDSSGLPKKEKTRSKRLNPSTENLKDSMANLTETIRPEETIGPLLTGSQAPADRALIDQTVSLTREGVQKSYKGISVERAAAGQVDLHSGAASLRLRKLRNKTLDRWDDHGESSDCAVKTKDARKLKKAARDDIHEVWTTAAELERELLHLHEELETLRSVQEEFEEERTFQQASIRELQEKLEQVEAIWKGRLKGAEHELNETERRLQQNSQSEAPSHERRRAQNGDSDERTAEMYEELENTRTELNRLQKERLELKSEVNTLRVQLKENKDSQGELVSIQAKYETLKTRCTGFQQRVTQAEANVDLLNDSLLEYESKNRELERLLEENQEQQKELKRHMEAMRSDQEHKPGGITGTAQAHDLMAELMAADDAEPLPPPPPPPVQIPMYEISDSSSSESEESYRPFLVTAKSTPIDILKKPEELAVQILSSFTINDTAQLDATDSQAVEIEKEYPEITKSTINEVFIEREIDDDVKEIQVPVEVVKEIQVPVEVVKEVPVEVEVIREIIKEVPVEVIREIEKTIVKEVPKGPGEIHIHLHQHYHTHMHQHTHQHDHVHYMSSKSSMAKAAKKSVEKGKLSGENPRKDLISVKEAVGDGRTKIAEIVLTDKNKSTAEKIKGMGGGSRLRPQVTSEGMPQRLLKVIEDGGGMPLAEKSTAFTYSGKPKVSGRRTDHHGCHFHDAEFGAATSLLNPVGNSVVQMTDRDETY